MVKRYLQWMAALALAFSSLAHAQQVSVNGITLNGGGESLQTNAGAGGTTAGYIAAYDPSANAILPSSPGAYGGLAMNTAAPGAPVYICRIGLCQCVFDGAGTIGDLVVPSTTTVGQCHDAGTQAAGSIPLGTRIIGALQTAPVGAGATGWVRMDGMGSTGMSLIVGNSNQFAAGSLASGLVATQTIAFPAATVGMGCVANWIGAGPGSYYVRPLCGVLSTGQVTVVEFDYGIGLGLITATAATARFQLY